MQLWPGSRASELHTALAIEKEESLLEASRVELMQNAKIDNLLGFAGGSMETENSGSGNFFFLTVWNNLFSYTVHHIACESSMYERLSFDFVSMYV
jgi:hypothetical protein